MDRQFGGMSQPGSNPVDNVGGIVYIAELSREETGDRMRKTSKSVSAPLYQNAPSDCYSVYEHEIVYRKVSGNNSDTAKVLSSLNGQGSAANQLGVDETTKRNLFLASIQVMGVCIAGATYQSEENCTNPSPKMTITVGGLIQVRNGPDPISAGDIVNIDLPPINGRNEVRLKPGHAVFAVNPEKRILLVRRKDTKTPLQNLIGTIQGLTLRGKDLHSVLNNKQNNMAGMKNGAKQVIRSSLQMMLNGLVVLLENGTLVPGARATELRKPDGSRYINPADFGVDTEVARNNRRRGAYEIAMRIASSLDIIPNRIAITEERKLAYKSASVEMIRRMFPSPNDVRHHFGNLQRGDGNTNIGCVETANNITVNAKDPFGRMLNDQLNMNMQLGAGFAAFFTEDDRQTLGKCVNGDPYGGRLITVALGVKS